MKLHKTRCPCWELIQLHLEESSGCLEFQGRAGHVLLGRLILGPRLEVGRFWLTAAGTPYTGATSRGGKVLANRSPTEFTWGQNTAHLWSNITRTSPFAKTKSIWHQAFGPHSKRSRILEFNNPTPQLKWQGFLPCSGRQSESVVLRTPMPLGPPSQIIQSVITTEYLCSARCSTV